MAGGGGARLWPASSSDRPKPLIPNLAQPDATLLGSTFARLTSLVEPKHIFVVTTQDHAEGVAHALPDLDRQQIISEPQGKNTAACVALACAHLHQRFVECEGCDSSEIFLSILPADHFVSDVAEFRHCLERAWEAAQANGSIVTLGIEPSYAETGYGYIEYEHSTNGLKTSVAKVLRFIEKPSHERAQALIKAGHVLWNAGIFVTSLARIEREFQAQCPRLWAELEPVRAALRDNKGLQEATALAYEHLPALPIDTAIMENAEGLMVVPADVGWSDVGNWRSVSSLLAKDDRGNASFESNAGRNVLIDCDKCTIWNEEATVAVLGLTNIAIIVSKGAVLVCPQDRAQDVRWIAETLNKKIPT
jgi:mannose-1-phosphate guanylyltransferase